MYVVTFAELGGVICVWNAVEVPAATETLAAIINGCVVVSVGVGGAGGAGI